MIKNKTPAANLEGTVSVEQTNTQDNNVFATTSASSNFANLTTSPVTRSTLTESTPTAADVKLILLGVVSVHNTGGATEFNIRIQEDGVTVGATVSQSPAGGASASMVITRVIDVPTAGSNTYTLQVWNTTEARLIKSSTLTAIFIEAEDSHVAVGTKTNEVIGG